MRPADPGAMVGWMRNPPVPSVGLSLSRGPKTRRADTLLALTPWSGTRDRPDAVPLGQDWGPPRRCSLSAACRVLRGWPGRGGRLPEAGATQLDRQDDGRDCPVLPGPPRRLAVRSMEDGPLPLPRALPGGTVMLQALSVGTVSIWNWQPMKKLCVTLTVGTTIPLWKGTVFFRENAVLPGPSGEEKGRGRAVR